MAVTVGAGGLDLTPSAKKQVTPASYLSNLAFVQQYLPDTYEKEFEKYGNRSISSFLRMVGAEMPTNSDLIQWSEQGRLHLKYSGVKTAASATDDTATLTGLTDNAIRVGQTVVISDSKSGATASAKAIVTASGASSIDVAFYDGDGMPAWTDLGTDGESLTVFVYGSEFGKGTNGMVGAVEATPEFHENNPIILKDKYSINGSDMAQIGWIEVTTENGASGYLWYIKSEHETRLRFEDYLETAMIEAVPATGASNGGAAAAGYKGSEGLFHAIENRGNTATGSIENLSDIDAIVARLDKQGAIEENVLFVNRGLSFEIDNTLAKLNGFSSTGAANAASFGLFDNDSDMALNLGFSGFRRGYDFYKSDWKYLNDASMRGGLVGGAIDGVLVPAGSTTVYDQVLGKNAKRPFLHVRYRASETEDRKMKSWIVGSAGGASNSEFDGMDVHFLSERALCTLGANNFFLFK
jgi:hypothetical protein